MKNVLLLCALLVLFTFTPIVSADRNHPDYLSRGEFFNLVVDYLESDQIQTFSLPEDVKEDSPYADVVKILLDREIIKGYNDGKIKLSQKISGTEASFILARCLGIPDKSAVNELKDKFGVYFHERYVLKNQAEAAIKQTLVHDENVINLMQELTDNLLRTSSYHLESQSTVNLVLNKDAFKDIEGLDNNISTSMNISLDFNKEKGYYQKMTSPLANQVESIVTEEYILPEGIYTKSNDPAISESEWFKLDNSDGFTFEQLMEMQEKNGQLNHQLSSRYFFYHDLGTENVNGINYKKVGIFGQVSSVKQTMGQLGGLLDETSMADSEDQIRDTALSLRAVILINQKTKLPYQQTINYSITYGNHQSLFLPIKQMEMKINMSYSKFNQINDIQLPYTIRKQ